MTLTDRGDARGAAALRPGQRQGAPRARGLPAPPLPQEPRAPSRAAVVPG